MNFKKINIKLLFSVSFLLLFLLLTGVYLIVFSSKHTQQTVGNNSKIIVNENTPTPNPTPSEDWKQLFVKYYDDFSVEEDKCVDAINLSDSYMMDKKYSESLENIQKARSFCTLADKKIDDFLENIPAADVVFEVYNLQKKYIEGMLELIDNKDMAITSRDFNEWKKYIPRIKLTAIRIESATKYRQVVDELENQ